MAFKSKKKFEYQPRTSDQVRARATAGGNREGFLADGVKTFTPKAGTHTVRILPPTWEEAEHYGCDIHAHYNIGPDGGAYLCLHKMKDEDCPICDERAKAVKDGDDELADFLKPRRRVACWIINRDDEREGPMLWMMPQSLDVEISKQSIDKKTGEVYNLDDPSQGYDVSFERQGDGQNTKYVGVQIDRKHSPLTDDDDDMAEWLAFVKENTVLDQLVYQEEEYLQELIGDGLSMPKTARDKARKGKDEEEDKKGTRGTKPKRGKEAEAEDEKPKKSKGKKDEIDVDDLDWKAVHDMDEDELIALAEQEDVDISDCQDEEEAANLLCEELKIKELKADKEKPTMRGRLAKLRDKAKGKND
jgi:hypothetical protein